MQRKSPARQWHRRLAVIVGAISLAIEKGSITRAQLEEFGAELKSVGTEMELRSRQHEQASTTDRS